MPQVTVSLLPMVGLVSTLQVDPAPQSVQSQPIEAETGGSVNPQLDVAVGASTDVRVRGFSISDGDAGFQASAEGRVPFAPESYLFANSWASTLGEQSVFGRAEVDLSAGVGGRAASADWRVFYRRVIYPSAGVVDFDQVNAVASTGSGKALITVGITHSRFKNGEDTWVFADAEHPIAPRLHAIVHLGYEDGVNWDGKIDWSVGLRRTMDRFSLLASYVDTNSSLTRSSGRGNLAGKTMLVTVNLSLPR